MTELQDGDSYLKSLVPPITHSWQNNIVANTLSRLDADFSEELSLDEQGQICTTAITQTIRNE